MGIRCADPRLGRLLGGKWRLDAILGEGATSTVYAATHTTHRDRKTGSEQRAAIKVLRSLFIAERELVNHFIAEGYLASAVDHPGVVKVLDDGVTDDGCPYLVLELLVGQTLEELRETRGGRISIDEIVPIADAIMDTLSAVHEAGITHRDLKPQNVIILDGGVTCVKLLDFGLAKLRGRTADAAQGLVGTPSFMPPEQALGMSKKMDAQSDVWALGATLFHALSGQPVHIAKHMTAMILASASTRPRSLADAAPELPRQIVEVIDRAIAYRKVDRWPDVQSMRSAWHAAHPAWLPTLPPPSYEPDPSFLDSNLLVAESSSPSPVEAAAIIPKPTPVPMMAAPETPMSIALFDPRDLLLEAEATLPHAASPHAQHEMDTQQEEQPARRGWTTAAALAATAVITVSIVVAAIALSREDHPRAARTVASPPPPAMDLPATTTKLRR